MNALQLRLHELVLCSVWKKISTLLVLLAMIGGRKYKGEDGFEEFPQLLSIKVVPSPSVILTKS